ncbi:MAG: hypothetical protein M3Q97_06325 [Bacteroidota bacterium]|nr:hypothetical protein [Bacteroidota bacterium]
MTRIFFIFAGIAFVASGCTRNIANSIRYESIPIDLAKTTLLVEKFAYADPVLYDPFYANTDDSLLEISGFSFEPTEEVETSDRPRKKDHPLIKKTNENLEAYNMRLDKAMKQFPYQYRLVEPDSLKQDAEYSDVDIYRYVLKRKPVLHCFVNPNGDTQLSYRYVHYFYDRKIQKTYPYIQVFSPRPWKTVRAIMMKAESE